jgi:hypothetical protein
VGTDATRESTWTSTEANWVNASWFGADFPMQDTDGYAAPPLVGLWASAPYFHNGSVPDVAGVLESSTRPARFKRRGTERADYDPVRLGWRVDTDVTATGTADEVARKVYDTTQPGLSNAGHTYGDVLTAQERAVLLAYLRTL